jgi:hypothetical protein
MITTADLHVPASYWNLLSQEDKTEFVKLRTQFHRGQKPISKDVRMVSLRRELLIVLGFLERGEENMEVRAILTGICFVGPVVCVNTRQLKNFLGRCKSSINGSLQQMGFVALRTKAKARSCVAALLQSLKNQQEMLRQWTVRYTSHLSQFCFVSSFPRDRLPEITADDLEGGGPPAPLFGTKPARPLSTKKIDFELGGMFPEEMEPLPPWKMSFSLEDMDMGFDETGSQDLLEYGLRRSESAKLETESDWSLFDTE